MRAMTFPRPLRKGDRIAIVSPASRIDPALVEGALPVLRTQGWEPVVGRHALGQKGTYSASASQRAADLAEALTDPSVRAILCSRGGYGAVHLIDQFPAETMTNDPKWLIGFSDISALHARVVSLGVTSIHASMCKHLAQNGIDECTKALFEILRGNMPSYHVDSHPYNHTGIAHGQVVGGNLAVLAGLTATPYDLLSRTGSILFIEDIAEPIYKVERQLYQLKLSGALSHVAAIIVGQFTEYRPDQNYSSMEEMIHDMTVDLKMPIAFGFPVGHVDKNLPIVEGATATLTVGTDGVTLTYDQYKTSPNSY